MAMLGTPAQRFLEDEGASMPDGERHATDLRHLMELLHAHDRTHRPTPQRLAAWLLARTEKIIVATGIANIYARDPLATRSAQLTLAEQSGGKFYREEDLHKLAGEVKPQTVQITQRREVLLWTSWYVWSAIIGLFTLEWVVRKIWNMS